MSFLSRLFNSNDSLTEVPLGISFDDRPITLLCKDSDLLLVSSFLAATQQMRSDQLHELYELYTVLKTSNARSPEEEASRITLLNKMKYKYSEVFNALSEATSDEL